MSKKTIYQYKAIKFPVPAQKAGEELERIGRIKGEITPEGIVDEARPEGSVLHPCFQWDDSLAAESWRKQQARMLTDNIVTVTVSKDTGESVSTRAFFYAQRSYQPIQKVMKSSDLTAEMLKTAMGELRAFEEKYRALSKLAGIFRAIDQALAEYGDH